MTDQTTVGETRQESAVQGMNSSGQEELYQWIADRRPEGYCAAQIFNSIISSGWGREAAIASMQHVMGDMVAQREFDLLLRGTPEPDLRKSPSTILVDGHEVQVLFEMQNPRVVVFGSFLTDDECDQIVQIAKPQMERSTVMAEGGNDGSVLSDIRTSFGTFLRRGEYDVCKRFDARAEAILNWPIDCTEDMQVLRYDKGAEYQAHHDYFDTTVGQWTPSLARGGNRCGTLVTYLNTPTRGGGTLFPDVPMEVRARKGMAVYFGYPSPEPSSRTLHAGSPVIEGEKWAAIKWFRQGPHR